MLTPLDAGKQSLAAIFATFMHAHGYSNAYAFVQRLTTLDAGQLGVAVRTEHGSRSRGPLYSLLPLSRQLYEYVIPRTLKISILFAATRVLYPATSILFAAPRVFYPAISILFAAPRVLYPTISILFAATRVLYCIL